MFPAALFNVGRFSILAVVNVPHTETRPDTARQFLLTSQNRELSVCPRSPGTFFARPGPPPLFI
jgi:hypothetical protein